MAAQEVGRDQLMAVLAPLTGRADLSGKHLWSVRTRDEDRPYVSVNG